MKEIMFSRVFPAHHPRNGEPTHFVEQMLKQLITDDKATTEYLKYSPYVDCSVLDAVGYKGHTIRKGHNFKPGDYFKPKIWTEKPYASVKYQFAPPVLVEKTFDFVIKTGSIFINNVHFAHYGDVCRNDGLHPVDFRAWFHIDNYLNHDFDGQIICWNAEIQY